ncbi:MAG: RNA polymerase sigma factor [Limisphaerales bacterium]
MANATDMDLVRQYAARQAEPAFEMLVKRHVNLVYSTALRRVGNPAAAEEITQAVFIILARKAAKLRPDTVVPAWLHETTRYVAASFLRGEIRRRHREQEAYMQSSLQSSEDAVWDQLAPLLDEAIGRLRTDDRSVVVLHYFQKQTTRQIAAALNIGEEAARKRLTRAVGKLRQDFFKRGINVSATALSGIVPAHSMQAAPVLLAKTLTASALVDGATASTSTLVKGALKIMAWTKAKTAAVATAVVILAAITGTMAVRSATNHSRASALEKRVEQFTVEAYYLEVPESDIPSVLTAGTAIKTTNDNSAEIMDWSKMDAVLRSLRSHGVKTPGPQKVVSLFGRQTQISGNNYVLDLFPTLLADGYGIKLKMKMPASSGNPLTVEANLWDGQTLALGGPPSGGQTRLFVFATVTMIDEAGNRFHSEADLQPKLGTIPPQL